MNSEESRSECFEFDLDERLNTDIMQFDKSFPDPLEYCIGIVP